LFDLLAHRRDREPGPARDAEFEKETRDVCLDGLLADADLVGDLFVRQSGDDEPKDLALARSDAWAVRT
jgi:hypothetical protein